MVGHTHEDIDAAFSKISNSLRTNDAETLPDLTFLLPSHQTIQNIFNIRDWLSPYISDLRKHTTPLHYKFSRQSNIVKVYYKGQHDSPWKEIENGLLQRNSNGKISKIRGVPQQVPINFDGIGLEKIEAKLNSWKCLFTDQMENTQYDWWRAFLEKWKSFKSNPSKCKKEIYDKGEWILPTLPKQPLTEEVSDDEDHSIPPAIQQLLDAETASPQVEIGRRPGDRITSNKRPANNKGPASTKKPANTKRTARPKS